MGPSNNKTKLPTNNQKLGQALLNFTIFYLKVFKHIKSSSICFSSYLASKKINLNRHL